MALGVLAVFLVVEVVGALLSGSLTLLADAGHMVSDLIGSGSPSRRLSSRRDRPPSGPPSATAERKCPAR